MVTGFLTAAVAGVLSGGALFGGVLFGLEGPAAARVTVTAGDVGPGEAAMLTFQVVNDDNPEAITRVEVWLPEEAPIAEVYPMSVDDWAPSITMRTLDRPLPALHGRPLTEVTSAVVWTAMPGRELMPGAAVEFSLSVGPIPDVPRLVFGVVQTHADGSVARWTRRPDAAPSSTENPAPVLVLRAGSGPVATSGAHHGAGNDASGTRAAAAEKSTTSGEPVSVPWVMGAFAVIGVISLFGYVSQVRRFGAARALSPTRRAKRSNVKA